MRIGGRTTLRLGIIGLVVAVLAGAAAQVMRETGEQQRGGATRQPVATRDPLAAELARCALLGEPALRDQACLDAWTESRRRFLAPSPPGPPQQRDTERSDRP
jgi:conjugative transfer region protein TrbK